MSTSIGRPSDKFLPWVWVTESGSSQFRFALDLFRYSFVSQITKFSEEMTRLPSEGSYTALARIRTLSWTRHAIRYLGS